MDIITMSKEMQGILEDNILNFWIDNMQDNENSGFYGRINGCDITQPKEDKGVVLNARILWTFSCAYRLFKKENYLKMATRAKDYIVEHFYDKDFGGVYWSVDYKGNPRNTKKQIYAIGFVIYGLSEYYRATYDKASLDLAVKLFYDIENYSFDKVRNGYVEAFSRDWKDINDVRLSEKDENEHKTMNTHLHVLEPYTNLYRVWKEPILKDRIENLINLFIDKIQNKETGHLNLFFDDNWNSKYNIISYGHDIEASWLIYEAAIVLNDKYVLKKVEPIVKKLATSSAQGLTQDGGMIYETFVDKSDKNMNYEWWVQAENVLGNINLYKYFNDQQALKVASNAWEFIQRNMIDYSNGEWFWSVDSHRHKNRKDDKAGFWKSPYHNGRMCMQVIEQCSSF